MSLLTSHSGSYTAANPDNSSNMYDTIIIGSGPSGLATALSIMEESPEAKVLIIEKGRPYTRRYCPVDNFKHCKHCGSVCNVISGFGGAIHYGDGVKLSLMPSGKRLMELFGTEKAHDLSDHASKTFSRFSNESLDFRASEIPDKLNSLITKSGLDVKLYPVALVGETQVKNFIENIFAHLDSVTTIHQNTEVVNVAKTDEGFKIQCKNNAAKAGERFRSFSAPNVVVASGRAGLAKFKSQFDKFDLVCRPPSVSVGVRFEMHAALLKQTGIDHPDLKLSIRKEEGGKTKTFCYCGGDNGGRIKFLSYQDNFSSPIIVLDGHATDERLPGSKGLAGNFSLLYQLEQIDGDLMEWLETNIVEPYVDICQGRPIAQTFHQFKNRISQFDGGFDEMASTLSFAPSVTDLSMGSVHELFPRKIFDQLVSDFQTIIEMILSYDSDLTLEDVERDILTIGLEMEFPWGEILLDGNCQTEIDGLYVVGDVAGYAQGIVQGMVMGFAAGQGIAREKITPALSLGV